MTTLADFGAQMAALPISAALRTSAWAYPAIEIVHLTGMALLFGTIAVVDLRLAGAARALPVTTLLRHVLPWTIGAFVAIVASGVLLFLAHADELATNRAFLVKLGLIALGLANALYFHVRPYRTLDAPGRSWNVDAAPPAITRACALLSLLTWTLVICAGRLIAYV
ncbi:DUF6644 family protein [Cupriavidus respiraculi]|uniref:DUF6644 family protein n=1 Tax=Cupriavidus respiraculi TaxID=195930 RepID=UPI002D7E2EEA|nr:DUF6644 family protein [Cupriavidus respiraculi]